MPKLLAIKEKPKTIDGKRLVPIERLNAIVVVTTQPKYLEAARTWVDRLDQIGTTSAGTRLFVYPVQNGKAENLAFLVSELF